MSAINNVLGPVAGRYITDYDELSVREEGRNMAAIIPPWGLLYGAPTLRYNHMYWCDDMALRPVRLVSVTMVSQ